MGCFVAYVTCGDPSPEAMPEILESLDRAGVDIIELGLPFSDPLADGPTIQAASGRALAAGTTVPRCLEILSEYRKRSATPVVIFTYLNPIFCYGLERFVADAAECGADGLLVLDMPPEELASETSPNGQLDTIRLVAPTTPPARMEAICRGATGFIYYVSREGVTGERQEVAASLPDQLKLLRQFTNLPVVVGFGISTPRQAAEVARVADGVVVGSAIVRRIAERDPTRPLGQVIEDFVKPIAKAVHQKDA